MIGTTSTMDLDLHIGSPMHLELPDGRKSEVRLMGLVPGRSLLVTAPEGPEGHLTMTEGDRLAVRAYAGGGVLAFTCNVQRSCIKPFHYLHLSYPETIESTSSRNAQRARVHLLGTAEADQAPGREVPVTMLDVSPLGAMIWADLPLGNVGESMILRLPLEADPPGTQQVAEVLCEIRHLQDDHGPPKRRWGYGVEFGSMSSATALALRTLLMREMARHAG